MKRLWEFISSASQSRTTALFVLLVIVAAIPLTVLVAQRQQNIQQKASEGSPPQWIIDSNREQGLEWNPTTGLFEYAHPEPDRGNFVTTPTTAVPAGGTPASTGGTATGGAPATGSLPSSCIPGQAFCSGTQICICKSDGTPGQCGACTNGNACAPGAGSSAATCGGTNLIINVDLRISGNGLISSLSQGPVVNTTIGSQLYIEWTTINNPTSCVASGAWSGNKGTSGTDLIPAAAGVYTITCSRAGAADVSDSITVTMSPATPKTGGTSSACAQFSQYCPNNNYSSCDFKNVPSATCVSTVTDYYQNCIGLTGNSVTVQVQSTCKNVTATGNTNLSIGLDGIGSTGDRANPNAHNLSNKTPKIPTLNIGIYPTTATYPYSASQQLQQPTLTYNSSSGKFETTINLSGVSLVKIGTFGHLTKTVAVVNGTISTDLVAGDVNNDNQLTVLDHSMLVACLYKPIGFAGNGCSSNSDMDINRDGQVDQVDYNIWLREFKTGPRVGD